jgi:hypothetical protein
LASFEAWAPLGAGLYGTTIDPPVHLLSCSRSDYWNFIGKEGSWSDAFSSYLGWCVPVEQNEYEGRKTVAMTSVGGIWYLSTSDDDTYEPIDSKVWDSNVDLRRFKDCFEHSPEAIQSLLNTDLARNLMDEVLADTMSTTRIEAIRDLQSENFAKKASAELGKLARWSPTEASDPVLKEILRLSSHVRNFSVNGVHDDKLMKILLALEISTLMIPNIDQEVATKFWKNFSSLREKVEGFTICTILELMYLDKRIRDKKNALRDDILRTFRDLDLSGKCPKFFHLLASEFLVLKLRNVDPRTVFLVESKAEHIHAEVALYLYLKQEGRIHDWKEVRFSISEPLCADCSHFFLGYLPQPSRPRLVAYCGQHVSGNAFRCECDHIDKTFADGKHNCPSHQAKEKPSLTANKFAIPAAMVLIPLALKFVTDLGS